MTSQIYLKNTVSGTIHILKDEIISERFIESYEDPNNLINIIPWYCDGGGYNGVQSLICFGKENNFIIEQTDRNLTNNDAEYIACLRAMCSCEDYDLIFSDSALVVNQVNGLWVCKADNLIKYCSWCMDFLKEKKLTLIWVSRDKNLAGVQLDRLKKRKC